MTMFTMTKIILSAAIIVGAASAAFADLALTSFATFAAAAVVGVVVVEALVSAA